MAAFSFLAALLAASLLVWSSHSLTLSSRLVHRFSDEARAAAASRGGGRWPARRSAEYYQVLARSDLQRQKRLLGSRYQTLFPSEGSETFNPGNDFGCCGRRQSGDYLDGVAPDGLLGLGFGEISVPSFLARSGLVRNSFSICFQEEDSGRIYFGDQGVATQQSTPFIPSNGKYMTYIVEVESFCIGSRCLGKTIFDALVDSGSSFTFLPNIVYKRVTTEFNRQVNASRLVYNDSPWEYCYKASPLEMPAIPSVTLMFSVNKSFMANSPVYHVYGEEVIPYVWFKACGLICELSPSFMWSVVGMSVFGGPKAIDSKAAELGSYHNHIVLECIEKRLDNVTDSNVARIFSSAWTGHDLDNSRSVHLTPPPQNRPENPLPTDEQQSTPKGRAVAPAVAGRTPPTNPSAASPLVVAQYRLLLLLTQTLTQVIILPQVLLLGHSGDIYDSWFLKFAKIAFKCCLLHVN
ncbi:hypothetical protein COCNU_05G006410 [Cocos nucifera]|uniref:Peptidase A1 domain-containing protein n=1 Tax=Cocos nucifera TaxID=13894 RepID=A0A8K0I8M6_COCNU|nr:hypothetical protein COCNU_05G006410 [Cocos nucifera]